MGPIPLVRVVRSGVAESVHLGSVAVADAGGALVAAAGDPDRVTFVRSAMKPLQAAVSLTLSGEDLPDDEVAVMCASHNGEPVHLRAVDSLLGRAGLDRAALRTPSGSPLDPLAAGTAWTPAPELHNCSGKHAGMLLACVRRGFDLDSYPEPGHPLQRAVLEAIHTAVGPPEAVGVDGCGAPVHALTLRAAATLYARLDAGAIPGGTRALAAMRAAPYMVAGRGRVCTAVMERSPAVAVKAGAEGLICAAIPDRGLGLAVKAEDGGNRALDPAIVRALRLLGVLDPADEESLAAFAHPPVLGGGRPVGEVAATFDLSSG